MPTPKDAEANVEEHRRSIPKLARSPDLKVSKSPENEKADQKESHAPWGAIGEALPRQTLLCAPGDQEESESLHPEETPP